MGLSKSDRYFIEKLGEIILSIPEDAEVPDNVNKYFIDKMEKMGLKIPEYTVGLGVEKHLVENLKEMGLKIPESVSLPKMELSYSEDYFWGLNFRISDETERYLNNLDINSFGYIQSLTADKQIRWFNIYELSKKYHLDTLINSSESYRKNRKEGYLTLPVSGSDIMDGNCVDIFHYEYLKKYQDKYIENCYCSGVCGDILAIYFCPEHKILTRQSSDEIKFYVYIRPSRFSAEIVLSNDDKNIKVLSKEKISNEILEEYLLYSEKNIKSVIGEEKINNYMDEKNGT
jgi:hypothetical protein